MSSRAISSGRLPSVPVLALIGAMTLLMAGTGFLWFHLGTAVFYEMVLAGLAACL